MGLCVGGGVPHVYLSMSWYESIIVMWAVGLCMFRMWWVVYIQHVCVLVCLHVCESGCVPEYLLGEHLLSKGVSEGEERKMTLKGMTTGPSCHSSLLSHEGDFWR